MSHRLLAAVLLLTACATERAQTTGTATPPAEAPVPAAPVQKQLGPDSFIGHRFAVGTPAELTAGCQAAIATGQRRIDAVKQLTAPRNTGVALEEFDEGVAALADMSASASTIRNSHPDKAVRDAAEACEQDLARVLTDISLDRALYDVIVSLDLQGQDATTLKWITDTLADFRRAGVDKDEATRAQVKALNEELTRLGQQFSNNIAGDTRFVLLAPKDLAGLPEDWIRSHPVGPDGKVKVTTNYPDYTPFMSYAKSGKAREQLWKTFRMRGHPANIEVLNSILAKRHQLVTLLGYPNWAAYVTEDKMIKNAQSAADFIEKISQASEARAKRDYEILLARKKKDDPKATAVHPWDTSFYEDRVKSEQYSFSSQEVRPYFEYDKVKQGLFDVTSKMFGITYRKVTDAKVWHPDVETFDVYDGQQLLGRFYLDMHPREDKYKHAAQFSLINGKRGQRLPEAVLMCNFPKPGAEPALMLHDDVGTFFHEFGHLIHSIFSGHTRWTSVAGPSMEWDFVEAPSQMLEEWTWDVGVLHTFAKHHQTGQPIPAELVKKMEAADDFGRGLAVRQQMFYAATSLNLHNRDPKDVDPVQMVKQMQEKYTPFKFVDGTYFHLSFGHLEGYSAIYYTYMWSLVIAKDLFTPFKQAGLMDPSVARAYREKILEPGGGDEAADLIRDFLGRDYSFQAYETWLNKG